MISPSHPSAARPAEPDLLRFSTVGSVDDGKSTLIGRLLHDAGALPEDHREALHASRDGEDGAPDFARLTDGLKAEREGRITIDVAYRHFSTARRRFLVADTPGHEQYTRNMATGASTADLTVALIDARAGVLTQSRRHAFISSLLGVPRLVVAVNKMDLVGFDESVFRRVSGEYREFVARLGFTDVTFIPMSAREGDNVVVKSARTPWYDGPSLLSHLENVYVGGDANLVDFRFPVQRVARPDAAFRGYAGTVASGVVRPGDEVVVMSSGRRSRVRRIVTADGDLDHAFPPQAVTLVLEDEVDVGRGDLIAHPNNVPHSLRAVDAMVVWMGDEPLRVGTTCLVKHTTNVVRAHCARIDYRTDPDTLHRREADRLDLNDIGRVTFTLFRPIWADEYRRNRATGGFVAIDPATNATVGAGVVVDRPRASQPTERATTEPASRDVVWHRGKVSPDERARLLRQRAATVWLTGLPGSGKSTIAFELEKALVTSGHACFALDGDNVRHGLARDLGFSPADRRENVRRVAEVARLFNDAGVFVVTAFISPYREDRDLARSIVGEDRFLETWISTELGTCEARDPKGLYARARAGEIPDFTGVSAPYEPPERPSLVLDAGSLPLSDCVARLMEVLSSRFH